MQQRILVVSFLLGLVLNLGNAQQLQTLKKKLLFQYDKNTKPDGLVSVSVAIRPVNVKLCAHSETMTLTTWTTYKWTDSRLAWDPTKNNNISELKFNYDQVWNPDIVPYYKQEPTIRFGNYKAIVYSSGMVLMVPEETFKIFCPVNVEDWPYGQQNCTFRVGSWHYSLNDVDVQAGDSSEEEKFFSTQYEVESTTATRGESTYSCCTEKYPHLEVSIVFKKVRTWEKATSTYVSKDN